MELSSLHHRTVETWAERVRAVRPEQWGWPTPCHDWSVRDLVNHVAGEDLWTVPLMQGSSIEEVGDRFDGDVIGDDPVTTSLAAAMEATRVVAERLPAGGTVQLSYGEEQMEEYVRQLAADHLIHGWDLAAAVGAETRLDPELVSEVATWFSSREDLYREAGAVGPRTSSRGDPQGALLAGFGRQPAWGANHAGLARFSVAFGSGDVDAIMALMTDDCVFEATGPAPDGVRHEGASAVRAVWDELFGQTRDATFTEEESFVVGDRGVLRWRVDWSEDGGARGHVRGVDVLRLRDGMVCEKLSYVKG